MRAYIADFAWQSLAVLETGYPSILPAKKSHSAASPFRDILVPTEPVGKHYTHQCTKLHYRKVCLLLETGCAKALACYIRVHLRSTQVLASACWDCGLMCFKLRPKHHSLLHLSHDLVQNQINPAIYSVWSDESFLGKIKNIARNCHGLSMHKRVLERWILSLCTFLHCDG